MIIDSPPNLSFHNDACRFREMAGGRDVSVLFQGFEIGRASCVKAVAIGVAETPERVGMAMRRAGVMNRADSGRLEVASGLLHLEQSG